MSASQYFFLLAAIYFAPIVSERVGVSIGAIATVAGMLSLIVEIVK